MSKEVRPVNDTADDDINITNLPDSFRELAEEVYKRRQKPKATPQSIVQRLAPAEFNTAMVQFYRGEIARSNVWRTRLDATTNWAVITAGATLSFVFSSPDNPHFAIPINTVLVSIFLFMEARRYRYYEVWANRVRRVEIGYLAPMLSQRQIDPDQEWAERVSEDLISPRFTITEWEAVGRRLRANYLWIFILLALSWTLKIYIHPTPIPFETAAEGKVFWELLFARAQVGIVPGWLVIFVGAVFNFAIFLIAFGTLRLRDSSSEVQETENLQWHPLKDVSHWAESNLIRRNTIRRSKKARQRMRSIHKSEG